MATLLEAYRSSYSTAQEQDLSLEEYLALCKTDPCAYATAAERMLAAIGDPELVDTRNDPRLGRIFSNRVIRRYPAFHEFFGMEDAIEQIVAFLRHAAQGLEERKQILYLLGPVGGGKSSIAERLKALMEVKPIYALAGSPVNESPLGLFPARGGARPISGCCSRDPRSWNRTVGATRCRTPTRFAARRRCTERAVTCSATSSAPSPWS